MINNWGSWKSQLGVGNTLGTPAGNWAGSLYADGARVFTTAYGEPVGRESQMGVVPSGALGNGMGHGHFAGGVPAWGVTADEVAQTAASSGTRWQDQLTELAPTIATIVEATQNPIKRYEVLKAKLENARRRGASRDQLNILQAKVDAAAFNAGLKREGAVATRQWRFFGQTAVVVGIGVGLAMIYFLFSKSDSRPRAVSNPRRRRSSKKRKSNRRRYARRSR